MHRREIIMLPFAASLAGCGSWARSEPAPRVTLVGLQPERIRLFEQRFRLTLRVENPGPEALRIRGVDCAVVINGLDFGTGVSRASLDVAPHGEGEIDVVVTSTLGKMLEQLRAIVEGEEATVDYAISGAFDAEGYYRAVPFEHRDRFSLRERRRVRTPALAT